MTGRARARLAVCLVTVVALFPRPSELEAAISFVEAIATPLTFPDGNGATGVATADLNGDGLADLAATVNLRGHGFVAVLLGGGDGTFRGPMTFAVPRQESGAAAFGYGILARDFDGDGKADILVACSERRELLFYRGDGDGTLADPVATAATCRPEQIQATDLDGDGKLDAVAACAQDDGVSVFLGAGSGTFRSPADYAVGDNPQDLALANVDGAGGIDIVLGSYGAQAVEVLVGDGSGGFGAPIRSGARMQVLGLYVADFTGNGDLDAVVAGEGSRMALLPGSGDGTFTTPADGDLVPIESSPRRRFSENAAPDLDGNGVPDVVFGHSANFLTIGLGASGGGMTRSTWIPSPGSGLAGAAYRDGTSTESLVFSDFNGDGATDVAVASPSTNSRRGGLAVVLGLPAAKGTFRAPRSFATSRAWSTNNRGAALADADSDGQLDLLAITDPLDFLRSNGDGTLAAATEAIPRISGAGELYNSLRVTDFDDDGKLDAVWLGAGGVQGGPAPRDLVAYGNADGTFGNVQAYVPSSPDDAGANVVAIPIDGADAAPDLAIWTRNGIETWLYGTAGDRSFGLSGSPLPLGQFPPYPASGFTAADFDGDGRPDIVARSWGEPDGLVFWKGKGDGGYETGQLVTPGSAVPELQDLVAVDIDADGALDLAGSAGDGLYVLLGAGDGTFAAPQTLTSGVASSGLVAADFDLDGKADIAVAHAATTASNGFSVLAGNGDGTFDPWRGYAVGSNSAPWAGAGDLDGNEKPDVVVGHTGTSYDHFTVLLNDSAPRADLAAAVAASPDPVQLGQRVTYTITIGNAGPDAATAVVLTDSWSLDAPYWAATPSQGSCTPPARGAGREWGGGPLTCALGDLAAGAQASVIVELTSARILGTIWNTAAVKSAVGDPNLADNGAAASATAQTYGVRIFGPTITMVGDNPTYVLRYSNLLGQTIASAVLVFRLPPTLEYDTSSSGGTYHRARHEVFWNLGDLAALDSGEVAVRGKVPWGIPPHTKQSLGAALGWSGSPAGSPLDVAPYLTYEARTEVARATLTSAEVDALLAADSRAQALFAHAQTQGYEYYDIATRTTANDGSEVTHLWLFDPATRMPAAVTVRTGPGLTGASSILETFGTSTFALADTGGAMALDMNRNSFLGPTGTWAMANSPSYGQCLGTCIGKQVPIWVIGRVFKAVGAAMNSWTCAKCATGDKGSCAGCLTLLSENVPFLGEGVDISMCVNDCLECVTGNPDKCHLCDKDKRGCRPANLVEKYIMGQDVVMYGYDCINGVYAYGEEVQFCPLCTHGQTCKAEECSDVASCCDCQKENCARPREARPCGRNAAARAPAEQCDINQDEVDGEVQTAHDPNAKSGPSGDVVRGQTLSYVIDYENTGSGTAQGVFVSDQLSAYLDESSLVIEGGGSYVPGTRNIFWNVGDLAPGAAGQVRYSVQVRDDAAIGGVIVNVGRVFFPSVPEETTTNAVVSTVRTVVAEPQQVQVVENTAVPITLSGRDPAGRVLTYAIVKQPSSGSLTGTPPDVIYTPGIDYDGPDSFSFTAGNGLTTSEAAAVAIVVTPSFSDQTPPHVVRVEPADGSQGVAITADARAEVARVCFDEPLDPLTVTVANVRLSSRGESVVVELVHDQVQSCIGLVPAVALANDTTYVAAAGKDLKDTSGNAIESDRTWSFQTAGQGSANPEPATVDFCLAAVGTTSAAQSVTISNVGATDLAFSSAALDGTGAGDFAIVSDGCSSGRLVPGGNCAVDIQFAPLSAGAKSATLELLAPDATVHAALTGVAGQTALRLVADSYTVSEAGGNVTLEVQRLGSTSAELSASYATADESAVAGQDYVAAAGTVTVPAGQSTGTMTVTLLDDAAREAEEVFRVALSGAEVCGGTATAARVVITDDLPLVRVGTLAGLLVGLGAAALVAAAARRRRSQHRTL
ncbi:MAG: VCBS repeat-containing protein [Candidatus Schekmanbacteria bacterium]|nr:VCBS repeat-containing protein [Candidatus Schekmanbacteria bacterium]